VAGTAAAGSVAHQVVAVFTAAASAAATGSADRFMASS
jgi:hypothetical protein